MKHKMTKRFDISLLIEKLKQADEIDFAYLFGSAQEGIIKKNSDIDIAVYLNCKFDLTLFAKLTTLVEKSTGCECDLSILNTSSSILGMEALKGKLLFVKNKKEEKYVDFYAHTCRKYEDDIFEMEQNLKYRGY